MMRLFKLVPSLMATVAEGEDEIEVTGFGAGLGFAGVAGVAVTEGDGTAILFVPEVDGFWAEFVLLAAFAGICFLASNISLF